jgi:uncharacterized glyoxalase superfamily protein PhnB
MSTMTPYICVADAHAAIRWYTDVLGAAVAYDPYIGDDGRVGHVELSLDGARWMMSDEYPEVNIAPPDPARGNAVTLVLSVPDVDALAARVVDAGVLPDRGPEDSEHGRVVVFRDPFGHRWYVTSLE